MTVLLAAPSHRLIPDGEEQITPDLSGAGYFTQGARRAIWQSLI